MEGGFCPESIFPSPEEREYRERWSPFKGKGDGGFSKKWGLGVSPKSNKKKARTESKLSSWSHFL
jgi:hypothetical protein